MLIGTSAGFQRVLLATRPALLSPFRRSHSRSPAAALLIASLITLVLPLLVTPVMAVSSPAGTCPASVDHHYLGDYPDDLENFISEELQGIAHDEENWFFARNNDPTLWKFPLDDPTGGISRGMPGPMDDLGYDHFGDLDHYGGILFMPVEPVGKPALAAFRASDLHFIDFKLLADLGEENGLTGQQNAGWVAVDPHPPDGLGVFLYMSNDELSSSSPLFRYRLDFDSFIQTQDLGSTLTFDSRVYLFEADGSPITSPSQPCRAGSSRPGETFTL